MKEITSSRIKKGTNNTLRGLRRHKFLISLLLMGLLVLYYDYINGGISLMHSDLNEIISFVNSFGFLSILAFLILVIVEVIIAPIPSLVLYAAGGVIFGTFWGGTAALLGNILGAIFAFKIAQRYGRRYVEKSINKKKLIIFDKFSKKYGGYTIFLLRLNPLTSSDIFSYLAGLTQMPLKHVALGTALGLAPIAYVESYIGYGFVKDNPLLYSIFIFISLAYFIAFFYGIYHIKTKK